MYVHVCMLIVIALAVTATGAYGASTAESTGSDSEIVSVQYSALPSLTNTIFVLYAEDQVSDYDLASLLRSTSFNAPTIYVYEISNSELTATLRNLVDINAIALDESAFLPSAPIPDLGDFQYRYGLNPNSPYEYTNAQWLQDINFLESEVAWLNENFRLPYDVLVEADECGEANAFYYPIEKKVTICYEYIDHLGQLWYMWPTLYDSESDAGLQADFVYDNLYSTLYHEIGHAILDVYGLPYTGLEENVADQFAALMLIRTEGGQDMLYNVGDHYLYSSHLSDEPHPYWDTHGTDMQRFYNISCYAYGEDPDYNMDLIEDGWLPEDRAYWCEEEYEQIKRAFGYLIADYTNGFFDVPSVP